MRKYFHHRPFITCISLFFIAATLAVCPGFSQQKQETNRLSRHPVITGITWDFAHEIILAPGSDLWPVTWGADDNIWTGWGDGGGFGGADHINRVSVGFAKISGIPPGITGTNV
ncbi:MAG: hypothetical protein ACHQHN_18975, partial [Sphingobacteriales bacterium]